MRSLLLLPLFLAVAAAPAWADNIGDPANGQAYVKRACASCHAVSPDETVSPVFEAPAFAEVANTPGMTRTALTVWLNTPHPTMPNFVLEGQDLDDVIAYILSLKSD